MANNNISIKTINDLLKSNFFIPSYQRGYRWTEQQVTDLLNDINEFSPKEIPNTKEKTWYCLQPIVVKKKVNKWEVIDGQQRLTTIYLILHYLKNNSKQKCHDLKLFGLEYETRENSADYLQKELNGETINDTNIDYYFISSAYRTVCDWFKSQENKDFDCGIFMENFLLSTKVIWYESKEDEIDIFTRINSGKIPLTNAELIKALFLNSSNFENADSEKLRLKQLEIASEWDRIEYALQDDSFWYFINKNENNLTTRIEFIFNLMYDASNKEFGNDKYSTFRYFSEKFKSKSENEIEENWQEIKNKFQTLEEWYNDRELYHKIGYLIAIGTNIKNILKEKKEKTKTEFSNWINQEIKSKFRNVNLEEVEYNKGRYEGRYVREILLLHNIQTMLNNENETNRFPFDRYKKDKWDIEHIHAIATEAKVKDSISAQRTWLMDNYEENLVGKKTELQKRIENIQNSENQDKDESFQEIIDYVLGEEDNSLKNLCLLDRGTNRSYKNDSFKNKRKKIIEQEKKGTFIPICTRNVFMKYYSEELKQLGQWSENDRNAYLNDIKNTLKNYLPKTELTENEQ